MYRKSGYPGGCKELAERYRRDQTLEGIVSAYQSFVKVVMAHDISYDSAGADI